MQTPNLQSIEFFQNHLNLSIITIEPIINSASDRMYYRVYADNEQTYILTESHNIHENHSYFYFYDLMSKLQQPVPKLLGISSDQLCYIQQDLGDKSLLRLRLELADEPQVYRAYQLSVEALAQLQIASLSIEPFDDYCYDFRVFDSDVVFHDLFYAKNLFFDLLDLHYSRYRLIQDIKRLAADVSALPSQVILYRDFQARNLMIYHDQPYFIDFQGIMRGFVGYDIVSLLWQAKANLPFEWKESLKDFYFSFFTERSIYSLDQLNRGYELSMILRFFQVLGAYGLRGIIERKQHFIDSIRFHIPNMQLLIDQQILDPYPELKSLTLQFLSPNVLNKLFSKI